jgi:hypothetical protein
MAYDSLTKSRFLQIEYADWSFYGKKESANLLQMQTPSFVGPIGLTKSQPKGTIIFIPMQIWMNFPIHRKHTFCMSFCIFLCWCTKMDF